MEAIHSPTNPLVKELRRLHKAAGRREQGAFLVEGRRAIDGFLRCGWQPQHCLVRDDAPVPDGWPAVRRISAAVGARLSQATTPSGYVACFPVPSAVTVDADAGGLLCWGLRDPGNLGTLLRSAAACAVAQVVLVDCCDPWSSKVLQAGAGALARLRIERATTERGLACLRSCPGLALIVAGGEPPTAMPSGPSWLMVGGEADGLPEAAVAAAQQAITLPMASEVESLNAAVAASIALYLRAQAVG